MSSSILTSYGYSPEEDQISKRLDAIAMNIDSVMSADVLKKCMSFMDLTSLHNEDTPASIEKLVGKVNAFKGKYPEYPLPASICVYPNFAGLVRRRRTCHDGFWLFPYVSEFPGRQGERVRDGGGCRC